MIALALMVAAIGPNEVILTGRGVIALREHTIRLKDVVARGAALGAAAGIEIARVPAGSAGLTLSRRAIATLVRRSIPGLTVAGVNMRTIDFRVPLKPRLVSSAAVDLPKPAVASGDAMTLAVRVGPVTVERPVTAMQPGHVGKRVFVRDTAGHVFSAPLVEAPQ